MTSARFDIPDDPQSFQKPAPSGPEVSAAGGLTISSKQVLPTTAVTPQNAEELYKKYDFSNK
jgi:hypothetical protein